MNTQIQSYQFQSHSLRIIPNEKGEPWFIAKDVCNILGYTNSRKTISDHCRNSGVTNSYIQELSNTYTLIDEGNLYRLIIKSNKSESEPFESWVCDDVLPTIRKTGGYSSSITSPVIKNVLSLSEFDACREALYFAQQDLRRATVTMTGAELLSLKKDQPTGKDQIIQLAKDGLTRKEIVAATGHTNNNVRQAIFQARKNGELTGNEGLLK